ncbi:hypothetical protein Tco_0892378 [Tanacetum coccineum]|uniref:Uncharacterized protein n=1 Tax=Tanacetum coccineum TaxID=301880 RepID=A0ABQ5C8Y0_9ASTR
MTHGDLQIESLHSTSRLISSGRFIEEGNSFKPVARTTTNEDGTSTTTIPGVVTIEENILKKNDLKALSILMMTLPSEHLLTFNKHKDAKSLFEAIEARFGGNEATKMTQKTLLKQMYETFSENITLEELNLKFLRSLPIEWGMHVVVWRNKSDLGSISFDDLYNNFKIVEPEVKRSITSSSNSVSQNLAFVSGHSSTNDDNIANIHVSTGSSSVSTNNSIAYLSDATVYAYLATQPNGSQVVHEDLEQIHEDDLDEMDLKWQLALLSIKARKCYQKLVKRLNPKSQENRSRSQDSSRRTVNVEEASPKAMLAIDDLKTQYDKLRVELRKSESDLSNYKRGLASVEEQLVFYKKNESMLNDQIAVLKRDASYKDSYINDLEKQLCIRGQIFVVFPLIHACGDGFTYVVDLSLWHEAKDSEVCKITRADGTSSFHGDFQALLRRLNKQDLFQLYSLVQERYKHRSIEGHDLDLWGDLKMMFDPNEEDDIWLNQHYWELLRWKLHEYSGVHSLFLDGTSIQINMLVDKKYPLKKEILKKMINLKIKAEEESDMASELIKFIKSQIAEQS